MVKQVFSGGGYQWDKGRHKEKVKEGEYGSYILYSCMKREDWKLEIVLRTGRGIRENERGGKSN
jgi:hypothetical protein